MHFVIFLDTTMYSFSTRLHEDTDIDDSAIIFGIVNINIGNGYDEFTGLKWKVLFLVYYQWQTQYCYNVGHFHISFIGQIQINRAQEFLIFQSFKFVKLVKNN